MLMTYINKVRKQQQKNQNIIRQKKSIKYIKSTRNKAYVFSKLNNNNVKIKSGMRPTASIIFLRSLSCWIIYNYICKNIVYFCKIMKTYISSFYLPYIFII